MDVYGDYWYKSETNLYFNWVGVTTLSATCWPSGSQRPHVVGDIPILYHVKGLNHHIEI